MPRAKGDWVTLRLERFDQIDDNIETMQRVIDGEPLRPADTSRLIGVKSILTGIKEQLRRIYGD